MGLYQNCGGEILFPTARALSTWPTLEALVESALVELFRQNASLFYHKVTIHIYIFKSLARKYNSKASDFRKSCREFRRNSKLESSAERWSIFETNWRTNSYIFAHAATTICIFSVFEYRPRSCSNLFHAPSTRQSFSSRRRGRRRDT